MSGALSLFLRRLAASSLAAVSLSAWSSDLLIYDDALQNGFQNESYANGGAIDLASTSVVRSGTQAIAFDPANFGAVALRRVAGTVSSADYPMLRLWLHGGANGGQQLRVWLIDTGSGQSANRDLDVLAPSGALVAGLWQEVLVPLTEGALAARPVFDRIEIQSDIAGVQPRLHVDDIALLGPEAAADAIFASTFEAGEQPIWMFVPQYSRNSLRIYRQSGEAWSFVREAPLGAGVQPNAVAFDPNGKLWVANSGVATRSLRRYSRQALLNEANPAPEVEIGPVNGGIGDIFALAFHGDSLFVSQGFSGVNHVLRYALADLGVSGNPAPVQAYSQSLNVPAGLAFDAAGKLWISNYGNNTLVRMSLAGAAEWVASSAAVGPLNSLNLPEGLAFDAEGSLWAGNNGESSISVYSAAQLAASGASAPVPLQMIDIDPMQVGGDAVGGLAIDAEGRLWANYQKTDSVLGYALQPLPGGGYQIDALPPIAGGASFPGFGGLAIWPVPPTLHLGVTP